MSKAGWMGACAAAMLLGWSLNALADAPATSCLKTAGKARAQRLVNQCLAVTGATHPPCNALNDCETISEHATQMCRNHGADTPAFCRDAPNSKKRSARERDVSVATIDQADAVQAREHLRTLRARIEPLAAKRKAAVAALKTGQGDFTKALKAARSAYDKLKASSTKPGAIGLDAAREANHAQFDAVLRHGEALAKAALAAEALDAQLLKLSTEAAPARLRVKDALKDAKDIKTVIDADVTTLGKANTKAKTPDAAAQLAKGKEQSAQVAAIIKGIQALELEAAKEATVLPTLAGANPAARAAQAQAVTARTKLFTEQQRAAATRAELAEKIKAAAARHRRDAPSAKASQCDLEKVDFRNFSYPSPYHGPNEPLESYKNGKLTHPDAEEGAWMPTVSSVKFFDLDGNKQKEAVVFIEKGPSAHSGPNNELRFMELDGDCRIQQVVVLTGGIYEGILKGKSYFYSDTTFDTPEGQSGNFATGTELVETRFANSELHEIRRKPER